MTAEIRRPIPRKLDEAMIEALCSYIAKGNYYHDACSICGITPPAFYGWINQAKADELEGLTEDDSIYIKFTNSIQTARAKARAEFVAVVREAAVEDREWIPAITYLERTDPEHWGRKDRTRIDVSETKEIIIRHVEVILNEAQPQLVEGEYKELEEGK